MGVWIETFIAKIGGAEGKVAPYVGVWIETTLRDFRMAIDYVAPYVGVWIETYKIFQRWWLYVVAPYVGVWIETIKAWRKPESTMSHPMWVCGLKPENNETYIEWSGRTLCGCVD